MTASRQAPVTYMSVTRSVTRRCPAVDRVTGCKCRGARYVRGMRDTRGRKQMKASVTLTITAAALVGTIAYAAPAFAHHSFAATYFEDKTTTVEGDLVQFLFRNPHSFVHIEGPDAKGQKQR